MRAMESRRLVVWISTGILGFQGATLAFDLRRGVVDPEAPEQPSGGSTPDSPVALFCARPQGRVDAA
jgi:hypothetical protein